ncbi:MAG: alpha/beta fold hydrolase [Phenylobacterium sp.]|uniref:alpha/beta fold hydrolase n=1 Tax=Phenylobacterium sp. TaxID=1871053 RepID=UPI0025CC1432|nr:alpha/beta hydrolase [Phenylobacterium sp.]MCA6245402.1 alpha/beta fold hydrolase [Phenylobacterium sp.]
MPFANNGEVRICWESFGDPTDPAILLINGLGSQMTRWPEAFCEVLTGRGYRALRFDNRDTGDRSPRLARITAPTVVLHGADDPLLPAEGGRDTAAKIPGAELRIVEGMGHDLPPALFGIVADAILAAATRAGRPLQGA